MMDRVDPLQVCKQQETRTSSLYNRWLCCHSETSVQRHLYRLEKQTNMNLMGFNRVKCQVLHLEGNSLMHQYRLQPNSWKAAGQKRTEGAWWTPSSLMRPWQQKPTACRATLGRVLTKLKEVTQFW